VIFDLAVCRHSALLDGMSVSGGIGSRRGHRFVARGMIMGWLILVGSVAGAQGVATETSPEPIPDETVSKRPSQVSIETIRVQGWLDLGQKPTTLHPFVYGQSLETLGRGFEGGLWAELLEDRKFYRPPTAPGSPWKRLGGEIGWSLTYDVERFHTGAGSVKVTVTDRAQEFVHGIQQDHLPLSADKEYVGHVVLAGRGLVNIHLEWGNQVGARDVIRFRLNQEGFGRYPLRFRPRSSTTTGKLSIGLESTGSIWIGAASLMPANHREGLRADTMTLLEQLDTTIYRWPGGNALAGYDWRDGIGPRDQRPTRFHPSWATLEPNDFGIAEFVQFCRALDAEPLVVVDTGIGSPELAAALVQYCNGSDRTIWGRRRALNGDREPYAVRWWALGSGLPGEGQSDALSLEQRLARHKEFVRAMSEMDDQIRLVAVGQRGPWNEALLAEAAKTVDVLSERLDVSSKHDPQSDNDSPKSALRRIVSEYRNHVETGLPLSPGSVSIGLDGWNLAASDGLNGGDDVSQPWREALMVASGFHDIARHPDLVRMAHFAPQRREAVGTVHTTRTNAVVAAAAIPLGLYRHHFGSEGLRIEGELEPLDAVAALSADRRQLTIGILNLGNVGARLELELAGGLTDMHAIRHQMGFAQPLNTLDDLPNPQIQESVIDDFDPRQLDVPPLSLTLYLVPLRR
jgi:alpha-L-arabinofuranosidase